MSHHNSGTRRTKVEQLHKEIDKLALLVVEAKKQTDKIQRAADALGDDIFGDPDDGLRSFSGSAIPHPRKVN